MNNVFTRLEGVAKFFALQGWLCFALKGRGFSVCVRTRLPHMGELLVIGLYEASWRGLMCRDTAITG